MSLKIYEAIDFLLEQFRFHNHQDTVRAASLHRAACVEESESFDGLSLSAAGKTLDPLAIIGESGSQSGGSQPVYFAPPPSEPYPQMVFGPPSTVDEPYNQQALDAINKLLRPAEPAPFVSGTSVAGNVGGSSVLNATQPSVSE